MRIDESRRFALVPIELISDNRLTLKQQRVLLALLSFRSKSSDVVWPTRGQLADVTGMIPSNISAATTQLVALGWIKKEGKGGFSKSTRYRLSIPETVSGSDTVSGPKTVSGSDTVSGAGTVSDSDTGGVSDSDTGRVSDSDTGMGVSDSDTGKEHTNHTNGTDHKRCARAGCPSVDDAGQQMPHVEIAVALRKAGMPANSNHPKVVAWAQAGVSPAVALEALEIARGRKRDGPIPVGYLAPIIHDLMKPKTNNGEAQHAAGRRFGETAFDRVMRLNGGGDERPKARVIDGEAEHVH